FKVLNRIKTCAGTQRGQQKLGRRQAFIGSAVVGGLVANHGVMAGMNREFYVLQLLDVDLHTCSFLGRSFSSPALVCGADFSLLPHPIAVLYPSSQLLR